MHTIYRYLTIIGLLAAEIFLPLLARSEELNPITPELVQVTATTSALSGTEGHATLAGSAEASFEQDQTGTVWSVHVAGSFQGDSVSVRDMFVYRTDATGAVLDKQSLDQSKTPLHSTFVLKAPISKPDPDWNQMGFGMTLADDAGSSTQVLSTPFPIIWQQPVLIDHAWSGSVAAAPNYEPGSIPSGIGIPHTLINSIREGDYYAVVFFSGKGCPSSNFEINSFRANAYWGYDVRGPEGSFSKAFSTSGGGCMQKLHLDPQKDADWLWGALSNTATSSAVADSSGIPAFAICATASACDPIIPREQSTANTDADSASTTESNGVSSVLFLPGIKGSLLYEDNPLCALPSDSCGIALWPPVADGLAPELFLDPAGKSKRSIFVRAGGVLESAYGKGFYASFARTLDTAQTAGTFGRGWTWKPAAYDWRLSLPDIATGGAAKGNNIYFGVATDTAYLAHTLRELASTSPTGKVTVVAHSNGGLVAKALMQSLGDTLASQLIDTVIFVGVPQSGAPRALGALLYGEDEGLPGLPHVPDFMMSAAHAREFSLNAPMAYHLLPSARYLSALQPAHPLVSFDGGTLLAKDRAAYGSAIRTEAGLHSFALAAAGDRATPAKDDLRSANILNPDLLAYAQEEHAALDAWQPPAGITAYELGGYDVDTISGLELYQLTHSDGSGTTSYRPQFTQDGDGTVPVMSALMMNAAQQVHQIWLDLPDMRNSKVSYSHANMLDAPNVQEVIADILQGSAAYPYTAHAMEAALQPAHRKRLAFYVHSPASLSVRSERNERTWVGTDGTGEEIPGSTAGLFGEVKYVLVPADGTEYSVQLSGEGSGTFSLDLQELDGDDVTATSTLADVPVTNTTWAMLTIRDTITDASPLAVDKDGDGTTDFSISAKVGSTSYLSPALADAKAEAVQTNTDSRTFQSAASTTVSTTTPMAPAVTTQEKEAGQVKGFSLRKTLVKTLARLRRAAPEATSTIERGNGRVSPSAPRKPLLYRLIAALRDFLRSLGNIVGLR